MAFHKKMRDQSLAYSATDEKDFAQVDLTPISPAKSAGQRSSNSSDYARFRNDRILSSQDKRVETRQDAVPMPKSTRKSIFAVRRVQVVIRGLQLVGSGGLLAVLILLSNIPAVQSYIVRAPTCVDVVSASYAIYHLSRSAKRSTAGSSAAYHLSAIIIDACLIPFYVFTAMLAHAELSLGATDTARWTSNIKNGTVTGTLIIATWLGSIIIGGLHLVSFAISIYLCTIFRQIARLPPDMNPLESNLTSRASGSMRRTRKVNALDRPLSILPRPMSFFGTRQNNNRNYSPMNPAIAISSPRNLHLSVPQHNARPQSSNRKITPRAETPPPLDGETSRLPSLISSSSIYTNSIKSPVLLSAPIPAIPRKSSRRLRSDQLQADTWFVQDDGAYYAQKAQYGHEHDDDEYDYPTPDDEYGGFAFGIMPPADQQKYSAVEQDRQGRLEYNDDMTADLGDGTVRVRKAREVRAPRIPSFMEGMNGLGLNPPTPRGSRLALRQETILEESGRTALHETTGNNKALPSPPPRSKVRGYGDLADVASTHPRSRTQHLAQEIAINKPDWEIPRPDSGVDRMSPIGYGGSGRVVSRTGVDIGEERLSYRDDDDHAFEAVRAGLRGRNVSGKIAEEGRGGY